jgi:dolichol-phosphate mannosyltransferase
MRSKDSEQRQNVALSVVIPCYNEEKGIDELHRRVSIACSDNVGKRHEIVLIDDGSRDGTWEKMNALSKAHGNLVCIKLTRNYGHQLALTAGLDVCRGDRILIMDADLQDPPELLAHMLKLMDNEGAHVVYGRRINRRGESAFKRWSASVFYRTLHMLIDIDIPLDAGDFRLMSRKALDMLRQMPEQHRFIRGMVAWVGLKQARFDYVRDERYAGETKYPLKKMVSLGIDAITGFSTRPLRVASHLGLVFAGLAIIGIIYTFYGFFTRQTVSGWASLMSVVLALGSIQLLLLWVFGEYLGRVLGEVKGRPLFLIDEIVGPTSFQPRRKRLVRTAVKADLLIDE